MLWNRVKSSSSLNIEKKTVEEHPDEESFEDAINCLQNLNATPKPVEIILNPENLLEDHLKNYEKELDTLLQPPSRVLRNRTDKINYSDTRPYIKRNTTSN